jgi:hypothetical protein
MRSKAPLVLMEQLVMVLVFALAAAVCVQAFALADRISRRSALQDAAAVTAQSMAEVWKAAGGDTAAAAERYGSGAVAQGTWTVEGDGYQVTLLDTAEGGLLRTAAVDAVADGESEPLLSLTAACQEAAG